MRVLDYKAYLKGQHWRRLRRRVLRRDHRKCKGCGTASTIISSGMQVHHIVYNLHKERMSELLTLCPSCHSRLHDVTAVANAL